MNAFAQAALGIVSDHLTTTIMAASGVGGMIIAPYAAPLILGAVGFTPAGVAAGSMAAAMQAGIGNVAAQSLFAGAQAVGATGIIPVIGTIISGGVTAATAGAGKAISDLF